MTGVRGPSARVPPEILLRLAAPEEIPPSALRAQRAAEAAGWATTLTYCRGFTPESTRSAARLVDSLAVRCQRLHGGHLLRAVAVWLDGRWELGRIVTPCVSLGNREWMAKIGSWQAVLEGLQRANSDGARLPSGTPPGAPGAGGTPPLDGPAD